MLLADARDEYVLSYVCRLDEVEAAELEARFADMEESGRAVMGEAGFSEGDVRIGRSLEMRYVGQEFTLVIQCAEAGFSEPSKAPLRARFDELYEARYGHAYRGVEPEIVSLRVHVFGNLPKPQLAAADAAAGAPPEASAHREVYFEETGFRQCAIHRRADIPIGAEIAGPAVIEEVMSTTLVHPEDSCRVDGFGNLILTLVRPGGSD
jgi:N-methylhydantoinase A